DGRPKWADLEGDVFFRPTFTWTYPVLTASAHHGPHARPLRPGERRSFLAFVPESFDLLAADDPVRFGAAVTWVRFAP
ncbi:MAG TPA: hypothetical protein VEJ18_21890, partial [Planctomycetota bacterium]|nr:hypothetical protein [Planctomycetota bacterium]